VLLLQKSLNVIFWLLHSFGRNILQFIFIRQDENTK